MTEYLLILHLRFFSLHHTIIITIICLSCNSPIRHVTAQKNVPLISLSVDTMYIKHMNIIHYGRHFNFFQAVFIFLYPIFLWFHKVQPNIRHVTVHKNVPLISLSGFTMYFIQMDIIHHGRHFYFFNLSSFSPTPFLWFH